MISDDFIKSESLADEFVDKIASAKDLLESGDVKRCLSLLDELESGMQVVLAMGELCDTDCGPRPIH